MSLTAAAHERFWKSMGERFGKRWLDEMGEKPTKAWKDLLDQFSPDDVAEALLRLKDRSESQRAYIPTHAEFEVLLGKASRARRTDATDHVRGYWRATVVSQCSRLLVLAAVITEPKQFEVYLLENRRALGEPLRALLDELCAMEVRNSGQRTPGILVHADDRCKAIIAAHIESRVHAA